MGWVALHGMGRATATCTGQCQHPFLTTQEAKGADVAWATVQAVKREGTAIHSDSDMLEQPVVGATPDLQPHVIFPLAFADS